MASPRRNERLATHYQLEPVAGSAIRRVALPKGGPLGTRPSLAHRAQAGFHLPARLARLADALLGAAQLARQLRGALVRQLQAPFQHLALEPGVQLRGLGLALERPQPGARLALDVQCAVEILLRALELQLRTPAALAVL